jgi:hypothetical protein
MRINELLEGKIFNDLDFVTHKQDGKREINYDLAEDLVHFMNQDDHSYRRHVYPTIAKFLDLKDAKKDIKPGIFKSAVEECYKQYIKHFPIRELPDEIDEEMCRQVCDKMYEEVSQHHSDGIYKA